MRCTRCINDVSIPGIVFNKDGECNHCKVHDLLYKTYPLDNKGKLPLKSDQYNKAKRQTQKYNCIVGISGGRIVIHFIIGEKKMETSSISSSLQRWIRQSRSR